MFSLAIFFSVAKLKTTPGMGVACRKLLAPDLNKTYIIKSEWKRNFDVCL